MTEVRLAGSAYNDKLVFIDGVRAKCIVCDAYLTYRGRGGIPTKYCEGCKKLGQRRQSRAFQKIRRARSADIRSGAYRRKWLYGLTENDYLGLLQLQDGRCAICRVSEPDGPHEVWSVDHDHKTGAVRGLLCSRCNTGLGQFSDDVYLLGRAIAYLENPPYRQPAAATEGDYIA